MAIYNRLAEFSEEMVVYTIISWWWFTVHVWCAFAKWTVSWFYSQSITQISWLYSQYITQISWNRLSNNCSYYPVDWL